MENENKNEYNGWRNYATWAVYSWLSDSEESLNSVRELWLRTLLRKDVANALIKLMEICNPLRRNFDAVSRAEKANKEWFKTGMYRDILGWALQEVDWLRVAEQLLEDIGVPAETNTAQTDNIRE